MQVKNDLNAALKTAHENAKKSRAIWAVFMSTSGVLHIEATLGGPAIYSYLVTPAGDVYKHDRKLDG